ncbi:MAG: hypothetical protein MJ202_01165, partial [Lentisphaeria bacterium]|nr:hypothetical protein [Lentisphaeria bacterium]
MLEFVEAGKGLDLHGWALKSLQGKIRLFPDKMSDESGTLQHVSRNTLGRLLFFVWRRKKEKCLFMAFFHSRPITMALEGFLRALRS